jgi:hypothetical protein
MGNQYIEPRFVRVRDAPGIFGVDRNYFNRVIRPRLTEIRLSKQAIGFDIREIHEVADELKEQYGRKADCSGGVAWERSKYPVSSGAKVASGTSTRCTKADEFVEAVTQLGVMKPKRT